MTTRVLVFAEDVLGMTLARDLCDRVVIERGPSWLSDLWGDLAMREAQRTWAGVDRGDDWTSWPEAKELAKDLADRDKHFMPRVGLRGYAQVAYRTARLAAHLAAKWHPDPILVFFCIDTQGDETLAEQMREGVKQAKVGGLPITLAVMHQESEAWVVAGFMPENKAEESTLRQLSAAHGFDPTAEPHRLTPNRQTDPRDAKRVCKSLVPEVPHSERARRCWLDTSLDDLERRGAQTGLPEYLAAVKAIVLPALSAPISRR